MADGLQVWIEFLISRHKKKEGEKEKKRRKKEGEKEEKHSLLYFYYSRAIFFGCQNPVHTNNNTIDFIW